MIQPNNPILSRMLERLFAAMLNGPSMNCRPHASRQRLDLVQLAKFQDAKVGDVLKAMIGKYGSAKLAARVPMPPRKMQSADEESLSSEQKAQQQRWSDQQALRSKLRVIAEDARTYEQDTGVHALHLGFPLLSLPAGMFGGRGGSAPSRRVLAPIAFLPVTMAVKTAGTQALELNRREGVDLVIPNLALLAWLEKETDKPLTELLNDQADDDKPAELIDSSGAWMEIIALVRAVADVVEVPVGSLFAGEQCPDDFPLEPTPRADDEAKAAVLPSAVLGLFPASNQGLLRDTREMIQDGAADGPIGSFVRLGVSLDARPSADACPSNCSTVAAALADSALSRKREFAQERLITDADPCQARAVRLAREFQGLVVHGPPGTGKSQTITNIISDHLGRGQRVLFVCDKRTALDVVADRLAGLGLGDLCAIVHDPQRDQRDLYRSVREQLDGLVDVEPRERAAGEAAKVDADLQALHADLTYYHNLLLAPGNGGAGSFHHLVGLWLMETACPEAPIDEQALAATPAAELRAQGTRLKEVLERGHACGYATNTWKSAAGMALSDFLSQPMTTFRAALARCVNDASLVDATRDAFAPPFAADADLSAAAQDRVKLAARLEQVLKRTIASDRAHWAARAADVAVKAREQIAQSSQWIEVLRDAPIDHGIAAAEDASAEQLGREREIVERYIECFDATAAELARVKRDAGGEVDDQLILRWLAAGTNRAATALSRLRAAQAIATAVAQSTIEPSLAMQAEALAIDSAKMAAWKSALDSYLQSAGTFLGAFHFSRKSAAEAVVKQFGRTLGAEEARQIRDLLVNLQARRDLQAVLSDVAGETFEGRVDDDDLLGRFFRHDTVLSAICVGPGKSVVEDEVEVAHEHIEPINAIIAAASGPAGRVAEGYGLESTPRDARRLASALRRLEALARLMELFHETLAAPGATAPQRDDEIIATIESHAALLDLLIQARDAARTPPAVAEAVLRALREAENASAIVKALRDAPARAKAILKLEDSLGRTGLFDATWLGELRASIRGNGEASATLQSLAASLDSVEGVLRVREGLKLLPPALQSAAQALLDGGADAAQGYSAIRRAVLAGEIMRRLRSEANFQNVDGHRLRAAFDRYLELTHRKKQLVREVIAGQWIERQKDRLLNEERSRLNSVGADLRRRLSGRGDKAMRLRQVIGHGATVEGGDPLFDLRPVWMASPETVAQLFPRMPIFDLVVFDEASQCRLEEALPVLTRAQRVVIAGDPKQLPPTRFFESSIAASDEEDAEGEQELFEQHQGEIEDLLSAALGLDIHQCYLDVHYRSRHADLIGFSNERFYGSRLQAIPEHPSNRTRHAPLALVRADGTYEKRRNEAEADAVVKIIRELLSRPQPPSIGVACFNLPQRDLIVEKLEEAAEEDREFAAALAEARTRRGENSSEGLFVKNLENVQGDERDHLIISTTYGPDRGGKFRRNFGPVGKPGGGRRLNVLVTRAREQVHIVTSIPRAAYATLPPIPQGESPSGTWLLFAYLNHCERLEEDYATAWRILENAQADPNAQVNPLASQSPSQFARALAAKLVTVHNVGSDVHWGNEGFCVDLALHHPHRAEDVSIGVLCDSSRFGSDDPVEWEVFRTQILREQGWKLHRVWTPHFFRDPAAAMRGILRDIDQAIAGESERTAKMSGDAVPVAPITAPVAPKATKRRIPAME